MIYKKTSFYIYNTTLLSLILVVNNYLILDIFNIRFSYLFIIINFASIILYYILSKPLVEDVFNLNNKLKIKIEKTMHEINTPVSTIQLNSQILSSKAIDIKNIERLNKIDKACIKLIKLYEDIEYYIKKEIEDIKIVSFDLKKLATHCSEKYNDLIIKENKNITINVDMKSILVVTDKNGLEIVFDNLISNAIKHNKNISKIDIYVENGILHIQDDGDGIESKNIYKVFDKYYQGDKNIRGFGIGLSIVKEFCDTYKLDIKIDSSAEGTNFNLNLNNIIDKDMV